MTSWPPDCQTRPDDCLDHSATKEKEQEQEPEQEEEQEQEQEPEEIRSRSLMTVQGDKHVFAMLFG